MYYYGFCCCAGVIIWYGDAVTVSGHPKWSNVNVNVYDNNRRAENRFMINVYIIPLS